MVRMASPGVETRWKVWTRLYGVRELAPALVKGACSRRSQPMEEALGSKLPAQSGSKLPHSTFSTPGLRRSPAVVAEILGRLDAALLQLILATVRQVLFLVVRAQVAEV